LKLGSSMVSTDRARLVLSVLQYEIDLLQHGYRRPGGNAHSAVQRGKKAELGRNYDCC